MARPSLTRQSSNSSLGSLNRPVSINSSTHVTKEKAEKVMKGRRSSRPFSEANTRKPSSKDNKEANKPPLRKVENPQDVMQSPTPYWKVAKEKGKVSPRETRASAKKKKGRKLDFFSDEVGDKENHQDEAEG